MKKPSNEKKYLILFFGALAIAAGAGNYFAYLTMGPDVAEESFTYGDFDFKIRSDLFVQDHQLYTIGDFAVHEIDVTSNLSEVVTFQHNADIKFLDTVVHESKKTEIKLLPNKSETIKVILPIEHEEINHISHYFAYYYENEPDKIIQLDSRVYSRTFLNTDQILELIQYVIILKYLWVLAIPLILGSLKATHDLFEKTIDKL